MESHKPPIITAHDADSPESPVEADRAAHPHCLLLLPQKILAEKPLLCLFLTSSFVRIFFEVLISSLQLFNLHTELLPAKKQEEVSTHVFIPMYPLPSLQVQTYQTALSRLDSKQVSWLHSTQIAPILKDMKQSGIQWTHHLLVWYRIKELQFSSTSKLKEGIQHLVDFQLLLLSESRPLYPVKSFTALPFTCRSWHCLSHLYWHQTKDHNAPVWAPPEGKIKFPGNATASQDKLITAQQLVCTKPQAGSKDHQVIPSSTFDWWF